MGDLHDAQTHAPVWGANVLHKKQGQHVEGFNSRHYGGEQNSYLVNIQRSLASYASFLDIKTTCPISNKEKVIGPPASEVAV